MQCEIRTMGETNARARTGRTSDTLPKPGRVTEVCKEWIVHEDGALAYKLQKEEVEQHYTGNKSRNAIVREDFPRAKEEQQKEEEEAVAIYHQMIMDQEERDAAVAKQLAQRIELEEEDKRRRLELHDVKVARQIQEKELRKHSPIPHLPSSVHAVPALVQPVGDVNSVGLPNISDLAVARFRNLSMQEDWPPPPAIALQLDEEEDLCEEEQRRKQELEDEELARLLQEQEERKKGEGMDQMDKDRMMAIEAQDKELARLLQDRERAKARRARERAKQKALLKKQQEAEAAQEESGDSRNSPLPPPPPVLDTSPRYRQSRYVDPEAIEVLTPCGSPMPNIAMAIDPTYSPHSTQSRSSTEFEEYLEGGPVPPYMPIQGQRRTSSLEKKKKKQLKEGCKQQ